MSGTTLSHDRWAELADRYTDLLVSRQRDAAQKLVRDLVADDADVRDIYLYVFQTSQERIGKLWERDEITVATEHYCTAITQRMISALYPKIFSAPGDGRKAVVACASTELHQVGARMVADFLQLEGWDTMFLNANVPIERVLDEIAATDADLVALSAALPDKVPIVAETIDKIRDEIERPVPIMVGGRPFNISPGLWEAIGADAYGRNAADGVEQAARLVPKP